MKFLSVPSMFSESYLYELNDINKKSKNVKIYETYGSIPNFLLGSIRPSNTIKNIDETFLLNYIKKSNEFGIGFNYTMNSTVLGNFEFDSSLKNELLIFIEKLSNAGLSKITVSVPYLIKFIHKHFPSLHIVASICMNINSVQELNAVEKMGAKSVVLPKDMNREISLLKKMIKNKGNLDLKLLCTTPCVSKCPDLNYHMNISSCQDNIISSNKQNLTIPEAALNCQIKRLSSPVEFIKSPWIRPEDLKIYQDLGINYFKLDGRDKPEKYLLEVIKAYVNENFDGNLLFLIQGSYPKNKLELNNLITKNSFKIGVYLDNKKLDKFLINFINGKYDCSNGCYKCNYCEDWKNEALIIDNTTTDFLINSLKKKILERY